MNLLQVREKFRDISGRFDLVNEDGTDNGADFFINEGRKYLDCLDETQKSWGNSYQIIAIDSFIVQFPYCRAVKEVWASSTTARWQLKKKNLQDLINGYLTGAASSRTAGTPLYYSPCITRYIPEDLTPAEILTLSDYVVDVPEGKQYEYNSVILNVPVSEQLAMTISGLFYSMELVDETDTNFWSAVHPMALVMAAIRETEIMNRNMDAVQHWSNAIGVKLMHLGSDLVEELIAETSQMGG